ncbi:MAG: hypothetical protein K8S27_07425 [Candidatus Omnitrophica bacterium]|nr:hypothetical protein [Candidatus Omnitrophota bacterium]
MAEITEKDRRMARKCVACPVCSRASDKQKGLAYIIVKSLGGMCPFCQAYEKVYGVKAHEPRAEELT